MYKNIIKRSLILIGFILILLILTFINQNYIKNNNIFNNQLYSNELSNKIKNNDLKEIDYKFINDDLNSIDDILKEQVNLDVDRLKKTEFYGIAENIYSNKINEKKKINMSDNPPNEEDDSLLFHGIIIPCI